MPAQNHIHKYYKQSIRWKGFKPGPEIIYHCALSDCTHYLPKRQIIGKVSLCNGCEDEIILTYQHLRVRKPTCDKCKRVKIKVMGKDITEAEVKSQAAIDMTVDKLLKGV